MIRYMRDIILDQGCLTTKVCVDLLVLNISMFILFSNVIDETITLLFNSFMGKKSYNKDELNEVRSKWVMLVTQLILSSV